MSPAKVASQKKMELPISVDAFRLKGSVLEEEGGKMQSVQGYLECPGVHQPR